VQLDLAGAEPATQDGSGARTTDRAPGMTATNMTGFI